MNDALPTISPIRDWLYVERQRQKVTPGGILLPDTFKAGKSGFSARQKMNAVADYFLAKVIATGPEVSKSEVAGLGQDDHCFVWSYADGDGSKLFVGESVGERDRIFVKPKDILCAVDL